MLRPLTVYYAYCLIERGLRGVYWTAAVYFYISVIGLDAFQLVIVGTALEVVILLGEAPTGVVADVYSRRLSIIIGVALMGMGFALDGALGIFWATLVAQLVWGLGVTFTSGAVTAWIADEVGGQDLASVYLRGAQFTAAGALAGIAVGVGLSHAGLALTMVLAGLGFLIFAAFLLVAMPEHAFVPSARGARSSWGHGLATLREGASVVRGSVPLRAFVGVVLFHGLASEAFDRLWELHLLGVGLPAGLTPVAWFGLVTAGGLVLSIAVAERLRRRLTGHERTLVRLLVIFTVSIALGMVAFGLARGFALAVAAYWATLLLRQLVAPVANAWANRHIPSGVRATVLSLVSQADAIGQIAGGPLFGAIARAHSTGGAMVAAGLAVLPAIALLRRAMRHVAPRS